MSTSYHPISPVSELLATVSKRWRLKRRLTLALLPDVWPSIVGDGVARHAAPLTMTKGELTLAVDSAVWMSELRYQVPTILARLNQALGQGKVKSLKLVQSPLPFAPPLALAQSSTPKARVAPEPTAEEKSKALELAASVAEKELGEALRRAYLHSRRLYSEAERMKT